MHISEVTPTEEKEGDEDNDAGRQDEVETFTNGVAAKKQQLE